MQELLKFKMRWGRPYVLGGARCVGRHVGRWEPLANLTNCEEAIATFERATGRSLPRRAPPPLAAGRRSRAASDSAGRFYSGPRATWRPSGVGARGEDSDDPLLVAARAEDGWQRSTVTRLFPRGEFSHVVVYSAAVHPADSLYILRAPASPRIAKHGGDREKYT